MSYSKPSDAITEDHIVDCLGRGPLDVARWSKGPSSVDVLRLTERTSMIITRGPGSADAVDFHAEQGARVCGIEDAVLFWDAGALTSSNLDVMRTCMGVGKANLHNLAAVYVLYDSPIVGMAITVVNLSLGGRLRFYRQREPFVDAFSRHCAGSSSRLGAQAVAHG